MRASQVVAGAVGACVLTSAAWVAGGQAPPLPIAPQHQSGQGVTPAYDGWFTNADGTFTLLVGYFNRNRSQTLDIPIGPNNHIDSGGPDYGQPTHFDVQHGWGVFAVRVPADFGTKKLTWTIVAGGETNSIPFTLHMNYAVGPFKDQATGNPPPTVKFTPTGPALTGPPVGFAAELTTTLAQPLTWTYWIADAPYIDPTGRRKPGPPTSSLFKHRGPGDVTFESPKPKAADDGLVAATARFSAPGDYVIRVQVNDSSGDGGGGFQCCWTNAHVKVTVKP